MQITVIILEEFIEKLNTLQPYDPDIPLLGVYLKKQKRANIWMWLFTVVPFIIAPNWKSSECPLAGG